MRICFVTTGDIETLATIKRAAGMAGPLHGAGHTVGVLAWDTPGNRERFGLEAPHADMLWIRAGLSAWSERAVKRRMLKEWHPDVVYVCAFGMRNSITRFELPRAVRVIVEHSELASAIPRSARSRCKERAFETFSVLAADGLLCASRYLEAHFLKRAAACGRHRMPVLYHPYAYNPQMLKTEPGLRDEILRRKGGRRMLLYMGTLAVNYGILDLLKGVKALSRRRNDFTFHILGRGRHASEARRIAAEMDLEDVVFFEGYVPEEALGTWFACTDVFLAPIYDTVQDKARCPSKVYMYLPFGKPIVTSRIGDPWHVLGEDGFYFPPGDIGEMAATISRALDQSEQWVPKAFRPQEHTWEYRTQQFLDWIHNHFLGSGETGVHGC